MAKEEWAGFKILTCQYGPGADMQGGQIWKIYNSLNIPDSSMYDMLACLLKSNTLGQKSQI